MAELDKIIIKYGADLAELKSDMAELKKTTTGFEQSATSSAKKVEDSLNSVGSNVKTNLTSAFKTLGTTIAAAFAIERIGAFISSSIELAAQTQEIKAAFDKLNSPTLLTNLRAATEGTLSDLKLMGIALKADKLQIPLEKLGKILQFAKLRADELGKTTEELADSLIQGIGIKGTRALVQVGISQEQFSAEVKKTGDYFTALDNIMTTTLENAGEQFESVADKQDKLRASIENTKVEIGNGLLPALSQVLDLTNKWIKGMSLIPSYFKLLFDFDGDFQRLILNNKKAKEEFESYTEAVKAFTEDDDIISFTRSFTDRLSNQAEQLRQDNRFADEATKTVVNDQIASIKKLIGFIENYRDTLIKKTEAQGGDNDSTKEAAENYWALGRALLGWTKLVETTKPIETATIDTDKLADALLNVNKELDELIRLTPIAGEAVSDTTDKAATSWTEYADQVFGIVANTTDFITNAENQRLESLKARLDAGLISQQQYDREEKKLAIEQAKREKTLSVFDVILHGIRSVMEAAPDPVKIALSTIFAATQLAAVVATPIPRFKEGVIDFKGKGTGTSDSNLALISRGESVITAKSTSKYKAALEAINNDRLDKYIQNVYLDKNDEADYRNYLELRRLGMINKDGFKQLVREFKRREHRF